MRRVPPALAVIVVAFVWATLAPAAVGPAHAQSFSTADLAGTWRVFQLATPMGNVVAASIRSYSGQVTFDATGAVAPGVLTDDQSTPYTVTGTLTLTAAGLLQGTLTLDDGVNPTGTLEVHEARALSSKFTIVGGATVLGQVGLFTFVKTDAGQTFSLNDDVANDGDGDGNYTYHEITPSDQGLTAASPGDANWSSGSITFHGDPLNNSLGCTEADLVRADGTIRAQRVEGSPTSFG
jgi:hypothetical protein